MRQPDGDEMSVQVESETCAVLISCPFHYSYLFLLSLRRPCVSVRLFVRLDVSLSLALFFLSSSLSHFISSHFGCLTLNSPNPCLCLDVTGNQYFSRSRHRTCTWPASCRGC